MSNSSVQNPADSAIRGRVRGVDHFTIPVRDLDTAQRFYVDFLGAQLIMRVDEEFLNRVGGVLPPERRAELGGPNSPVHLSVSFNVEHGPRIDLFVNPTWRPPLNPHPHWAFAVAPDELVRLRDALSAAQIPSDGPRRLGPPGQASVYFLDPFGNLLEFATWEFVGEIPVGAPNLSKLPYEWQG
jgi:catechol 2,3-dioxygenase-like lactoylglutathione lyase family enzyme